MDDESDSHRSNDSLFIGNPIYSLDGISYERFYAHRIIEKLSNDYSFPDAKDLFSQYFNYVNDKKNRGFEYDGLLLKLMYKIELDWIRFKVPVNESPKESSKIKEKILMEVNEEIDF